MKETQFPARAPAENLTNQLISMIGTIVCLAITGCGASESSTDNVTSTEDRRTYGIQFVRKQINSENEVQAEYSRDILAELQAARTETLADPNIASAVIIGAPDRNDLTLLQVYRLYIFWVEDQPSIDEIELTFPDTGAEIAFPVSDVESNNNLEVAEQNVVYTAFHAWEKGTEIGERLDSLADWENLKVRLLREKQAVTDWYPVSFYKMDHWVTNIPNPHREAESATAE